MSRENRCQHCGNYLVKCRNPNQRYCSETACQKQRKNLWRRNKLSTDGDYRSNQRQLIENGDNHIRSTGNNIE